jgi:hypothetical protein
MANMRFIENTHCKIQLVLENKVAFKFVSQYLPQVYAEFMSFA